VRVRWRVLASTLAAGAVVVSDTVTSVFWPQGRPDPDVFFAKA
jgi:hypothetical protein